MHLAFADIKCIPETNEDDITVGKQGKARTIFLVFRSVFQLIICTDPEPSINKQKKDKPWFKKKKIR